MTSKSRNSILAMLTLFGLIIGSGCSTQSDKGNVVHDTTVVNYTIKQGEQLPAKEWHCYNIDKDKICAPEAWGYVEQNNFFFLSDLSKAVAGSYFVVVKYDKKATGVDAAKYVKNLYAELKRDSTQKVNGYTAVKMIYTDKESICSEYKVVFNNTPYVVYSTVFENGNDLYDFSLKISVAKAAVYEKAYKNIIYNFYHNDKQIFTAKDKLVNAEIIDVTKL